MGAFLLHGLTPGPLIFQEAPEVVYAIYIGLILANVMLLGLGLGLIPVFSRLASVRVGLLFPVVFLFAVIGASRSEEHTSELQSLMRISYAVFCLKKKKHKHR